MNTSSLVRSGDQYAQYSDNSNANCGCQGGGRRRRGKSGKKTRRRRRKQTGGGGVPTYGYKDGNLSEVYRGSYAPVTAGNTADCQANSLVGGAKRRRRTRRKIKGHHGKKHGKHSRHNRRSRFLLVHRACT